MSELQVGDRVRINPRFGIPGIFDVMGVERGRWTPGDCFYKLNEGTTASYWTARELIKEKEMKYKVGDELEGEYSWTRTVVHIFSYNNKEYFVTEDSDDGQINTETLAQLETDDWKLKTDVKELTLDEVAKKFGVDVSKIRIKD